MVSEEGEKRSEEQQVAAALESNFLSFYHGEKGFFLPSVFTSNRYFLMRGEKICFLID